MPSVFSSCFRSALLSLPFVLAGWGPACPNAQANPSAVQLSGGEPCAPSGLRVPSLFVSPHTLPGQTPGPWNFGVAGGEERAHGRACLLLISPSGSPLPWAPCLSGTRGRLGPAVALDAQGVGRWSLPPAALNLGLDLRVVSWQRGAPWEAASVSGRVPQPPVHSSTAGQFPAGSLVITEFHKDPQAVSDAAGEWFEVYNRSSAALDIEGWVISDAGSDLAVLDNQGAGIVIQPGARLVLGVNADKATNGGVSVDAVYQGLVLSNSADEIYLSTPAGVLVDAIAYDNGVNWPDQSGRSAVLHPGFEVSGRNDDGWDWCSSTTYYGAGDRGTPGLVNDFCW